MTGPKCTINADRTANHIPGCGCIPLKTTDPAYGLLLDDRTTTPTIYRSGCYICEDPEFGQLGMPLCNKCPYCKIGHVPADGENCDDCGESLYAYVKEHGWGQVNGS